MAKPKIQLTTVWAPTTVTKAETFLWYAADPRLRVGVAYLHKQSAFRFLANGLIAPETDKTPAWRAGLGVQGIGTGNPGYFTTVEKNFKRNEHAYNVYLGLGFRANEDHGHLLAGAKYTYQDRLTFGIQDDGHARNPFLTLNSGPFTYGIYLIESKRPAILVSFSK